ncbi:unnamed protein product [Urochloa humidicola]
MHKRRGQEDSRSQGHSKRPWPAREKHLYLVLDDWEKGYSIHRIDPDTMLSGSDRDPTHLPEPAAFRFVAPALDTQFVAMGGNIVVVSSGGAIESPTLVYDTAAAALDTGPPLPGHLAGPIFAVAGGAALYAPTTLGAGFPVALEVFSWAPCTRDLDEPWHPAHEWSWKSVAAPPPPPFVPGRAAVVSYAAHPDGRTVFLSTAVDTYSFDAERREWTRHGAWALPFRGQGHFDRELDAWVGLDAETGYVCACQVPSRSVSAVPPESDRTVEKLFDAGAEGVGSGATLAYKGNSKFCLVKSTVRHDVDELGYGRHGRVVCVTMFGLTAAAGVCHAPM